MSISRLVDQQFAFAKAMLELAQEQSQGKLNGLAIKQAVISHLAVALDLYASEVTAAPQAESQAFFKLLASQDSVPDFRLDELRHGAENSDHWIFKLIQLQHSIFNFHPLPSSKKEEKLDLIASTAAPSYEAIHWREAQFNALWEIFNEAKEMVARHRDIASES